MEEKFLILNRISDLNNTIDDTLHQLVELGDRVDRGSLTKNEALKFKSDWEQYVEKAEKEIQILVKKIFEIS